MDRRAAAATPLRLPVVGRVLFVTWHGGGNVNPVVAIGQQLSELGHDVDVLGPSTLRRRFAEAGLAFTSRRVDDLWDIDQLVDEVTETIEDSEPDVVVVDYMLPGALCAAEASGRPTVALVHTLFRALLDDTGTVGPMGFVTSVEDVNGVRRQLGLDPVTSLGALFERTAQVLVTVPEAIDRGPPAPPYVTYVGPVFEPAGDDAGWEPPAGEGPLIVVTLGTTDMDELPVLLSVLDALAHERARIFATVGEHADPASIPTHANATVGPFVQHAAVLPHADLVISHGGIGTALAALAHGVPLLFLPLGRDQPANARAIAATGAAKVLPHGATPGQIARAADEVLTNPSYAEQARRLQGELAAGTGQHPATALIDQLISRESRPGSG